MLTRAGGWGAMRWKDIMTYVTAYSLAQSSKNPTPAGIPEGDSKRIVVCGVCKMKKNDCFFIC